MPKEVVPLDIEVIHGWYSKFDMVTNDETTPALYKNIMKESPSNFPARTWYGRPKGWRDLGYTKTYWDGRLYTNSTHNLCHTILKMGKENGELFKFCPRCEVKVE